MRTSGLNRMKRGCPNVSGTGALTGGGTKSTPEGECARTDTIDSFDYAISLRVARDNSDDVLSRRALGPSPDISALKEHGTEEPSGCQMTGDFNVVSHSGAKGAVDDPTTACVGVIRSDSASSDDMVRYVGETGSGVQSRLISRETEHPAIIVINDKGAVCTIAGATVEARMTRRTADSDSGGASKLVTPRRHAYLPSATGGLGSYPFAIGGAFICTLAVTGSRQDMRRRRRGHRHLSGDVTGQLGGD